MLATPGNAPPPEAASAGVRRVPSWKSARGAAPLPGCQQADPSSYLYVLPVLFFEFLALALAKSLLPAMMVSFFGLWAYQVIGVVETIKGCLAFVACPVIGKLSDVVGRRPCLFVTVVGTTFPVVVLAVTGNLWAFVTFQAFSGVFASTFPLTFAFISDYVPKEGRAAPYGLALATFGLSFSIGPVAGGYLAKIHGDHAVFVLASVMVAIDLLYISFVLPESKPASVGGGSEGSLPPEPHQYSIGRALANASRGVKAAGDMGYSPFQWNPLTSLRAFSGSPLLSRVAVIVFLYYMGVWALVSTLMVYVTRQLGFTSIMIGQLMSSFGVCTMFAEGVLVRVLVPRLGEWLTMQVGLLGFAAQCIIIGLAHSRWMVFASMIGSLLANLVYPSISSLVSRSVSVSQQGEVLGTINGVRALTEGFGPLVFGFLLSWSEDTFLPGFPYLIAAACCVAALVYSFGFQDGDDDEAFVLHLNNEHDPEETQGLLMGAVDSHTPEDGH